eukprot:365681-Chlamydomonas_euryale.AAC.6
MQRGARRLLWPPLPQPPPRSQWRPPARGCAAEPSRGRLPQGCLWPLRRRRRRVLRRQLPQARHAVSAQPTASAARAAAASASVAARRPARAARRAAKSSTLHSRAAPPPLPQPHHQSSRRLPTAAGPPPGRRRQTACRAGAQPHRCSCRASTCGSSQTTWALRLCMASQRCTPAPARAPAAAAAAPALCGATLRLHAAGGGGSAASEAAAASAAAPAAAGGSAAIATVAATASPAGVPAIPHRRGCRRARRACEPGAGPGLAKARRLHLQLRKVGAQLAARTAALLGAVLCGHGRYCRLERRPSRALAERAGHAYAQACWRRRPRAAERLGVGVVQRDAGRGGRPRAAANCRRALREQRVVLRYEALHVVVVATARHVAAAAGAAAGAAGAVRTRGGQCRQRGCAAAAGTAAVAEAATAAVAATVAAAAQAVQPMCAPKRQRYQCRVRAGAASALADLVAAAAAAAAVAAGAAGAAARERCTTTAVAAAQGASAATSADAAPAAAPPPMSRLTLAAAAATGRASWWARCCSLHAAAPAIPWTPLRRPHRRLHHPWLDICGRRSAVARQRGGKRGRARRRARANCNDVWRQLGWVAGRAKRRLRSSRPSRLGGRDTVSPSRAPARRRLSLPLARITRRGHGRAAPRWIPGRRRAPPPPHRASVLAGKRRGDPGQGRRATSGCPRLCRQPSRRGQTKRGGLAEAARGCTHGRASQRRAASSGAAHTDGHTAAGSRRERPPRSWGLRKAAPPESHRRKARRCLPRLGSRGMHACMHGCMQLPLPATPPAEALAIRWIHHRRRRAAPRRDATRRVPYLFGGPQALSVHPRLLPCRLRCTPQRVGVRVVPCLHLRRQRPLSVLIQVSPPPARRRARARRPSQSARPCTPPSGPQPRRRRTRDGRVVAEAAAALSTCHDRPAAQSPASQVPFRIVSPPP